MRSARQPLHLLLVEDDDVDVLAVRRALRNLGSAFRLQVLQSGRDALEALRGGRIDRPVVVLLDLNMPRMTGFELLEELRRDEALRTTPVFVYSTSADERDKRRAWALNVAGYMVKPPTQDGLVAIASMLESYWNVVELP
jgi:CheY-like chemotaxis protein